MSKIEAAYFFWMVRLVDAEKYESLLSVLNDIDYHYILPMDGNREADGISLRYRFGYDQDIDDVIIANELDIKPCSVLEMLVALALRCEEDIMGDVEYGNRTGKWFYIMLAHLGFDNQSMLYDASGRILNLNYIFSTVDKLMSNKISLFPTERNFNMNSLELWQQLQHYLLEYEVRDYI